MKSINRDTQRSLGGGWYWGNIYCPVCHKKYNASFFDRAMHTKQWFEVRLTSYHGQSYCGYWLATLKH